MRSAHEAAESVEAYSPAEELFNRRRRTFGLFAGAVLLLVLLAPAAHPGPRAPAGGHPRDDGRAVGDRGAAARRHGADRPRAGDRPARRARRATAFAPFADPIIFLFIGSFMLAEAMFVHGLDRRIAFGALSSRLVGRQPGAHPVRASAAVAAAISMWISNTATTAMMFPIGLSIVAHLTEGRESEAGSREVRDWR